MEPLRQLQALLRELFQLEFADLDFGLYRLLHLKRQEVEAFLTEQLPQRVEEAFKSMAGQERSVLEKEVSELAERIRKDISADALPDSGEPDRDHPGFKAKFGQELLDAYEAKRRQLQEIQVSEAQQAEVFNHLHAFFSRYYEAGDFIPRRRYGARETYAVPYNGEETFFHWANKDQHYVKTAEAFRDYAFTVEPLGGPYRVHFVLTQASVPPGNTKGDTRYFFPLPQEASWNEEFRTFRLPFHYRLPTEKEVERFGKNSKLQEALLQDALDKVLRGVPNPTLRATLSTIVERKEDQGISLLLKRLRHFSRRNSTDYFIHRNLDSFLKRELEFYLKDQVLNLGDLEGDLGAKQRTLRVIRQLAEEIIVFLAQIEEVEKRLFEKRKFVLRTDYLAPIKEVPRKMWPEVLANRTQVEAWKSLFGIEPKKDLFNQKGKVNERFLEEHPTLVVDSRHFDQAFKDRFLAAFGDLDEATDGLLIHSENYQALRLLERKCAGKVKCIYIDPPYNTGSDEFVYKDRYQHSSWLAMADERLDLARDLLKEDGALFHSIDGVEFVHLKRIMQECFGVANHVGDLVWKNATDNNPTRIATEHEYVVCFARNTHKLEASWKSGYSYAKELLLGFYEELKARGLPPEEIQKELREFIKDNAETVGELERYKFVDSEGPYTGSESVHNPHPGGYDYEIIHPVTKRPMRKPANGYRFPEETMRRDYIQKDRLIYGPDENRIVKIKLYLRDYLDSLRSVVVLDGRLGAYTLSNLFGEAAEIIFSNPKPVQLLERLVSFATTGDGVVLDFAAGSGTTGHAVINENLRDGGKRRFVLVEMGEHFSRVLVRRVQKVMFAPEWKDGKPSRPPTDEEIKRSPRLVKVLRVEGYEDALHNTVTEETARREAPRAAAYKAKLGEDAYRLGYLVRLPLEASASMLNLAALEHPFRYTIEVLTEDGPQVETVDLVETFNFLYGLHVERMETWVNDKDKRNYRAVKARGHGERRVLVLWRDMGDLDPVVEREFLEAKLKAEGPFDEMLINGDTATPGLSSLDGLFKRLMEEGES